MKRKTLLCLPGLTSAGIPAMDYAVPEVTFVYADENKKRDALDSLINNSSPFLTFLDLVQEAGKEITKVLVAN